MVVPGYEELRQIVGVSMLVFQPVPEMGLVLKIPNGSNIESQGIAVNVLTVVMTLCLYLSPLSISDTL